MANSDLNSEKEYKKLAKEIEMIMDNIPGLIFYKDTENNYIRVNKYVADAHKMTKKEMEGKSYFELYPKDQAQAYWDDDLEVIRTGKPKLNIEEPWETAQGTSWVSTNKIPYIDDNGNIKGIIGFSIDITARKRREEEVLRNSDILEAINKILNETMKSETDENVAHTCLAVAEELTGSKFGFIGEVNQNGRFVTIALSDPGWVECKIPKSDAVVMIKDMEIRGIWGRVIEDEKSLIINKLSSHPDSVGTPEGHPPVISFLGVPLKFINKTIGMIALANKESGYDLADQQAIETLSIAFVEVLKHKRAEMELRKKDEELEQRVEKRTKELKEAQEQLIRREKLAVIGKLAGSIGHELRNPLSVISNSAYYLNMKIKDTDEKVRKHLNILQREVIRSNKIISDLLDFIRVKLPSFNEVNVNSIVNSALDNIKLPENIILIKHLDAELPRIQLDPNQIQQVFQNIILNAVQAMLEGGKLKIKTQIKKNTIEIIFKDTGMGIPKENLQKIFEPLFTTKAKGIGLGLSIVKDIVEKHKGKIEVESEVNVGTTIAVKLPLLRKEET